MENRITVKGLQELPLAAAEFIERTKGHALIAFYAPMGAGKTTFTTAICKQLGIEEDAISSPTFAIVNEYKDRLGSSVFHFDFYRLRSNAEALDIGLYEYLDSGCLCLMEWPENIEDLLPEETLKVQIAVLEDGTREITWQD